MGEGELDDADVDRVDMWAVETDGEGFIGRNEDGYAVWPAFGIVFESVHHRGG